jgi:hypothetical protein
MIAGQMFPVNGVRLSKPYPIYLTPTELTKFEDKDRIFLVILYRIFEKIGRARWGASGALLPTIRYSGVEFLAEAALFLVSVSVSGVDG